MFGIDAAISGVSQANQAAVNWLMQEDAQDFARYVMRNKIQWMMGDLKSAGLNPILAAGSAFGGAGVAAPMGRVGGGQMAGIGSSAKDIKQARLLDAQTALTKQELQKKTNETTILEAQEDLLRQTVPYLVNSAKATADREGALAQIQQFMIPGASAMSQAQSTQAFRDALKFKWSTQPYVEPFQNLLNFNVGVGGLFGGAKKVPKRNPAGFK